jgi:hypothetical protein
MMPGQGSDYLLPMKIILEKQIIENMKSSEDSYMISLIPNEIIFLFTGF